MNFQNRCSERDELQKYIKQINNNETIAVCLHSGSGIGKSAFTEHFIRTNPSSRIPIRIKLPLKSDNYEQGIAISMLAREISQVAEKNKYMSFREYLIKTPNAEMKRYYLSELCGTLGEDIPFAKTGMKILDSQLMAAIKSESMLFSITSGYTVMICRDYIEYIMKSNQFFVVLENIQTCDRTSLEFLERIFTQTKMQVFILEYTDSDDTDITVQRFLENTFTLKPFPAFYLKKLEPKYYVKIMEEKLRSVLHNDQIAIDIEKCTEFYEKENGNLYKLLDDAYFEKIAPLLNSRRSADSISAPTTYSKEFVADELNEIQIMIITMIFVCPEKVHQADLHAALSGFARNILYKNINESVDELIPAYIDRRDGILQLKSCRIAEKISEDIYFLVKKYTAYSIWADYYTAQYEREKNLQTLNMLLHLYMTYEPQKILIYRKDILDLVNRSASPQHAADFLVTISNRLLTVDKGLFIEINIMLIELYYNIGLYQESFECLEKISHMSNRPCLTAYRAFLLNRLDLQKEAITYIIQCLRKRDVQENSRLRFVLLNILIVCYGTTNEYKYADLIYNTLLQQKSRYDMHREYGFFLRNSVILFEPKDSLKHVENSLKYFDDDIIEKAHSLINYSMTLSRVGMNHDASLFIQQAKEMYMGRSLERHVLYNNIVVLDLKTGKISADMLSTLNMALVTAETVFDRIVIYKNMLVISCKLNMVSHQKSIAKELLAIIESEPNNSLKTNTYLALSICFRQYDEDSADRYLKAAQSCYDQIVQTKGTKWRTAFPARDKNLDSLIGYLSYWHFPIDSNL